MTDKKNHLWIPEQEIKHIDKTPTGRGNDYPVQPHEHGEKLSRGLRDIMKFFQHIQSPGPLDEKDLIAFQVLLQDKEDFSVQRKLIESEGLTINAVKNRRQAVVSAPRSVFANLQKRVDRYRDKGIKKDFKYIKDFLPFRGEDKSNDSFRRFLLAHAELLDIDIQMVLLPDMASATQTKAEKDIVSKIRQKNGHVQGEPYHLTDGTAIIRAKMSPSSLMDISDDPRIYQIKQTSFFRSLESSGYSPYPGAWTLDPTVDINSLPTVVILDDGVQLPGELQSVVAVQWSASGCSREKTAADHGTFVASRAAFGYIGQHGVSQTLVPRARIIDAQIAHTGEDVAGDTFVRRVQEAVKAFADVAKIFNLSYNATSPIEGDEMSLLGSELDSLSQKYDVRFVISAGNHVVYRTAPTLKEIIDDDDSRIAEPADALLGITVGAIAGEQHEASISKQYDIVPYARRGPGAFGFSKPDLVAYGATIDAASGQSIPDTYALGIDKTGFQVLPGTSFTAPIAAGDLAQVLSTVQGGDINLAQALLYNGAQHVYDHADLQQDVADYASNLYGHGLSSPENSMYSSENRVSFVHSGTMNRLEKQRVKFFIPASIANLRLKRGEKKLRVTVTCVTCPPTDRSKGDEYVSAYVSASIHRLNSNGKNVTDNPSVSEKRRKWDTCCHFSNEFSSFSPGDWEVWLELFTRWSIADDQEIPYSLVVTLEDLTSSNNLYSEIIRETAGRFQPMQALRLQNQQ